MFHMILQIATHVYLTVLALQLGSSAILGILKDNHLNANQYNWLSSIFYFGYLLAEYPQNWALQRFPVGKWLAANLILW